MRVVSERPRSRTRGRDALAQPHAVPLPVVPVFHAVHHAADQLNAQAADRAFCQRHIQIRRRGRGGVERARVVGDIDHQVRILTPDPHDDLMLAVIVVAICHRVAEQLFQ